MKHNNFKKINGLSYSEEVFDRSGKKCTVILLDNSCRLITEANEYIRELRIFNTSSFNTLKRIARDLGYLYDFLIVNKLDIRSIVKQNLPEYILFLKELKVRPEEYAENDYRKIKYSIEKTLYQKVPILERKNNSSKVIPFELYGGLDDKSIDRIFERCVLYLKFLYKKGIYHNSLLLRELEDRKSIIGYLKAKGIEVKRHETEPVGEEMVFTEDNIEDINKASSAPYERILYFILEKTGIRIGEALGLEIRYYDLQDIKTLKGSVFFKDGRWTIRVVWDPENDYFCRSKGHKDRVIQLKKDEGYTFELLLEKYLKWREMKVRSEDTKWFFISNSGKQLTQNTAFKQFKRTLSKIGLNRQKDLKPHSYRHTWATTEILKGVPIELVAKALGHKDSKTTEKIYFHLTSGRLVEIREKADKKMYEEVEKDAKR